MHEDLKIDSMDTTFDQHFSVDNDDDDNGFKFRKEVK